MLDAVLGGVAAGAFGVAPVVLGDELFFAAGCDGLRGWGGFDGEGLPDVFVSPGVADVERIGRGDDAVAHGERGVGLLVERVGDERDRGAGDELANEYDAALAC